MTTIITVGNHKGGVGKTATATTQAGLMALQGRKVLLIDACAQGTATKALGERQQPYFHDWLVRDPPHEPMVRPVAPEVYVPAGETAAGELWLMPGDHETHNITGSIHDPYIFYDRCQGIGATLGFDQIWIDTSPVPSMLNAVLYTATKYMIYVSQCEDWSIDGLEVTLQVARRASKARFGLLGEPVQNAGIIPTFYRAGRALSAGYHEYLQGHYDRVCSPVRDLEDWRHAANNQQLVYAYAPKSGAAQEARRLHEELGVTLCGDRQ
jgi:chromosome partitioning protein